MTQDKGYFYAAQDADNFTSPTEAEPEEGDFYVWTYSQLESLLSEAELRQLQQEFSVTPGGNFEGKNVLQRLAAQELSAELELALDKLFAVRYGKLQTEIETFPPLKTTKKPKLNPGRVEFPPLPILKRSQLGIA